MLTLTSFQTEMIDSLDGFAANGYATVASVLDESEIDSLLKATALDAVRATHTRGVHAYANRAALSIAEVSALATSEKIVGLAQRVLSRRPFAVRAILFDKVNGANWKIPWHQDITIAVKEQHDVDGYGAWSTKEGSPHVQAPTRVLENMVAVRLHLDDCDADNGPLRVVPGSHAGGRIKKALIPSLYPDANAIALTCEKGDAILMSPLTVHASSPASNPNHRRVIHIEYACCDLDSPLEWARRI